MSKTGNKAMAQLRERLAQPGQATDSIILRRDLVSALVGDIDTLTLALQGITCSICGWPKFGDGGDRECSDWHKPQITYKV